MLIGISLETKGCLEGFPCRGKDRDANNNLPREGDTYRGAYKDAHEDLRLLLGMFMWMLIGMSYCL